MFSRSFAKSPKDAADDITLRAILASSSVLRSPACSGEENYTYKYAGFRTFQLGPSNYVENLVHDYEHFIAGGNLTLLPYHNAIAALHHTYTAASVRTFIDQLHIQEEVTTPCVKYTRTIQHERYEFSKAIIQRPLNGPTLSIAHGVARAQVTAISALHPHQRLRIAAGSLIALLALRLSCERTSITANINQHLKNYRDSHYVHKLHHDGIHRILRRASGSQVRANQIAAPYTECATHLSKNIPAQQHARISQYMAERFQTPIASYYGPCTFYKAEYYACKCLKLIGNPDDPTSDPIAASRWSNLRAKVQSIRRGERTPYQVITDPGTNGDYWVFAIHHTYHQALKYYLDANREWLEMHDRPSSHIEGTAHIHINTKNGAGIYWPDSHEIRVNASRNVQTTLMVRAMYRFMIKASRILSTEFVGVFGFNHQFIKVAISRAKQIATYDGDEASAIMFAHFMPCLMSNDVHLDIFVEGNVFQHPELYVKMSDPVLGTLKKEFREVIPSRHTGTIDRATLMDPLAVRCRA